MISEQHAMIYLASSRGCTQSDWFRTYHSLNFGSYFNKHRAPFHGLSALNDETLKASHTISHPAIEDCSVLLLPIVGGINYAIDDNTNSFADAGESVLILVRAGSVLHITNPYEYEVVNYLHAWIAGDVVSETTKSSMDLPGHQNNLIAIHAEKNFKAYVGRFSGRFDSLFKASCEPSYVFVYVIEGAFEFQNRLLENRDGLALTNVPTSEFEALSDDAILLIMEV
jgi:hypothetical protein